MTVVVNVVDDDAMIMECEERIVVTQKLIVMIEKYDFVLCFDTTTKVIFHGILPQ